MGEDPRSMERADTRWQLVLRTLLRGKRRLLFPFGLMMASAGALLQAAPQHFAVAIPALEGPVTMGIFSDQGSLLRLLWRDAPVETIPAGLNGLIMTWDGKDDRGADVPIGTYRARGLVHGPLRSSAVPFFTPISFPSHSQEEPILSLPSDGIVLRAAQDELLESRPLICLRSVNQADAVTLAAEGLPLLTIPMIPGTTPTRVFCTHGAKAGQAILSVERGHFRESYLIDGLEKIVPVDAGKLGIFGKTEGDADAFHPETNAGESVP